MQNVSSKALVEGFEPVDRAASTHAVPERRGWMRACPGAAAAGSARTRTGEGSFTPIAAVEDVVIARQRGRALAVECGFSLSETTILVTVISELSRNVLLYAEKGEIVLGSVELGSRRGVMVTCRDRGPGIEDVQRILTGGYSTSGGLGLGLSGVRRIVDEFHIETAPGIGTVVTAKQWPA